MTRVCYDRAGLLLRMEGHAQAGPEGQDLVCDKPGAGELYDPLHARA